MLCIAHRGASGYAPESTCAAFERAIAMGADATETDVQLTADGHLVLFHDDAVDRTSDGRGPLADYTLAALRALDLGRWYGEAFAGERILTVAEALDAYAARIPFALEIKDPRGHPAGPAAGGARGSRWGDHQVVLLGGAARRTGDLARSSLRYPHADARRRRDRAERTTRLHADLPAHRSPYRTPRHPRP